jgi:hypothetical protein
MAAPQYRDPVIKAVIDFLEPRASRELKGHYYYGDVLLVPKSDLPIVSVAIDQENLQVVNTMEDKSLVPLVINVLVDYNSDMGRDFDLERGTNKLYELVAARNPDFTFTDESLLGLLRSTKGIQPTEDGKIYLGLGDTPITADFGIGVERRGAGIFSIEGVIRVVAEINTPIKTSIT